MKSRQQQLLDEYLLSQNLKKSAGSKTIKSENRKTVTHEKTDIFWKITRGSISDHFLRWNAIPWRFDLGPIEIILAYGKPVNKKKQFDHFFIKSLKNGKNYYCR